MLLWTEFCQSARALDITSIANNDFGLAYFCDVGMNVESILLSNLRLAPIQVCGFGHAVSTYGSKIDYYISGSLEEPAETAQQHYSERLVLLPGSTGAYTAPLYPVPRKEAPASKEQLVINCSWYSQKFNHDILSLLRQVLEGVKRKIIFRFFVGPSPFRRNSFLAFARDLNDALGSGNVEIAPYFATYGEYMEALALGSFSIESYPFGSFNTFLDSIHLGKPFVALEGSQLYNRFASAALRQLGCEELVARNPEDYVECIQRLVEDEAYLEAMTARFQSMDLNSVLFDNGHEDSFRRAIEYLMLNHKKLQAQKTRAPVCIQ